MTVPIKVIPPTEEEIDVPACCPSERVYLEWREAARLTKLDKAGFCTDCTLAYATRMRVLQRCAHPDIIFGIDEHGYMEGRFPTTGELNEGLDYKDKAKKIHRVAIADDLVTTSIRIRRGKARSDHLAWWEKCQRELARG